VPAGTLSFVIENPTQGKRVRQYDFAW
jgi:hypothetical protein